MQKTLKQKIDEMVDYLVEGLKKSLGDRLESITLTGSYVVGKISIDRPDVNIILFFKNWMTPDDLILLGDVLYDTVKKFQKYFSVRPEFRPYRFPHPVVRKKQEVFVNPLLLNMAEKDLEFPFNIPHWVFAGMKEMRKVVFGSDVLATLDVELTPQRVIAGGFRELPFIKIHLDRIPVAYDINKDCDLFFNESLAQGKLTAYDGIEIAMSADELKKKKWAEVVGDKQKMLAFFQERYDKETALYVKTLLEARENYNKWKNDKDKAVEVFKAAFGVWQKIWEKLSKVARET